MNFIRKCPDCEKKLQYSRKDHLREAIQNKVLCKSCAQTGRMFSNEHKRNLGESLKGNKNGKGNLGKIRSEEHKRKLSEINSGKTLSDETRQKMRLSAIARIEQNHGVIFPNYNLKACKLIEEYGKQNGYNFQHAENGGEFHIKKLGYWVDGYDVEQNVVIEIDESHHVRQQEKDKQRQQEITEHLGCEFIRIKI